MKTTTINLYEVSELSKEAFQKAYEKWREHLDNPFLQPMLNDECNELLKAEGVNCTSNHPVCLYSLSYCQGDGLMFEGDFEWNGYSVSIKHTGHYYHSNSKVIEITDEEGNTVDTDEPYKAFEVIYQSICKNLEKLGYEMIEYEESEAHFIDDCNTNEWTFEADGTIRNIINQ